MIVFGIMLIIAGLCVIEDGGVVLLIIGGTFLFTGISKSGAEISQTNEKINNYGYDKKIQFIINFTLYMSRHCLPHEKSNYENQVVMLTDLKRNYLNLNDEGRQRIGSLYDSFKKIVDDYKNEIIGDIEGYEDYNEKCPLPISGDNIIEFEEYIKNNDDMDDLDVCANVVRYLMLINDNELISRKGYDKYNTKGVFPVYPEAIHLSLMQAFITKSLMDEDSSDILEMIYDMLFCEELMSFEDNESEIKRFFRKKLRNIKSYFESSEDHTILPFLAVLDPKYITKYSPNKKSFELLGLSPDATQEEIEAAYKKLLILKHPDRGGNEKEWAEINEAYTKIKNNSK